MIKDVKTKLIDFILYPTNEYRNRRLLSEFKNEMTYLGNLTDMEFDSTEINIKVNYERKKTITSIFIITLVIAIISNMWKSIPKLIQQLIEFSNLNNGSKVMTNTEIAQVSFTVTSVVFLIANAFLIFLVFYNIRETFKLYKKMLIIEKYKKDRKD